MSKEIFNRAQLETLSFSDLTNLADDFGIDVPENLDRRFLIAELLELAEESEKIDDMTISSENNDGIQPLPKNYNETQIACVLRNPAWIFVYWNINDSDHLMLKNLHNYELKIRVCSLQNEDDTVPFEAYEIQASREPQEQNVLLPAGIKYVKVELVYTTATSGKVLAISPVITIPQGSDLVYDFKKGVDQDFPPVIQLSGIKNVLNHQYTMHRHSFS
ncbi:MAG: DUF4912 domain-containing protein [Treponema sp.]|jgi:hypothetical protein|nr:DUF4912 domain-containing protein [Treponema sp.]